MTGVRPALRALTLVGGLFVSGFALAVTPRELVGELPARNLGVLRLDADVGEVAVRAGDADTVVWRVRVKEREAALASEQASAKAVAAARVAPATSGDRVTLDLTFEGSVDEDDVQERWEVVVPRRFALDLELGVGELKIEDTVGGVDAELGIGHLSIRVPRGSIDAEVSIGDLEIESATQSPGEISVRATLGDVRLEMRGRRIEADRYLGVGGGIGVTAEGEDRIEARVRIGDARVTVK